MGIDLRSALGAIAYNFLVYIGFLFYIPLLIFKMAATGKYRHSFFARLGFFKNDSSIKKDDPVIWLHAVSVGETLATIQFQKLLKERFPGYKLLFTTTTETGYKIAREKCSSADAIFYFPLDLQFSIYSFINKFNIKLLVLTETEVWPNLLRILKNRNIPSAIINGRISDRSFKSYLSFSFIFRPAFHLLDRCLMQSGEDASRMVKIGARPEKVVIAGNLKYDEIKVYMDAKLSEIYAQFKYAPEDLIFVAGSVHPEEDRIVVDAYKKFCDELSKRRNVRPETNTKVKPENKIPKNSPNGAGDIADSQTSLTEDGTARGPVKMIIAPRKFDKIDGLFAYLNEKGIKYELRSELIKSQKPCSENVMVLDTVGELVKTYAMARLVFVGGSLVNTGGHNILEAAVFKKPVMFGPNMHNFREMSESFLRSGAGFMVRDGAELLKTMLFLFDMDEDSYRNISEISFNEVTARTGAAEKNIFHLQSLTTSDKIF